VDAQREEDPLVELGCEQREGEAPRSCEKKAESSVREQIP
jgi:hypothetical protein